MDEGKKHLNEIKVGLLVRKFKDLNFVVNESQDANNESILKNRDSLKFHCIKNENITIIFKKSEFHAPDKYQKFLGSFLPKKEEIIMFSKRIDILILKNIDIENEKRVLVLSVGDIRWIIDIEYFESFFGTKVILNFILETNQEKTYRISQIEKKII